MSLKVFNTLTRRKEVFFPIKENKVNLFVCGQTVYDDAHLGHAKTYVNFDVIVRWLRYDGYTVFYAQNITDVDDKIIRRAKERKVTPQELAEFYIKRFFDDSEAIGVKDNVSFFPKSTDYIPQIIDQIKTLIEKGYAYVVNGDVYYDVAKFKDYTKLSRMSLDELKKSRMEPNPKKRHTPDFSLWKSQKNGELAWDSPWGKGRPGWHIEDTAMTVTIFGPQYDIHGGANELIFPHHTNEIAQAEAATGKKPFVKYWLHSGVLNIKGEKMSKSLKNFITIREALERHDPEVLRMFFASTHYRKPIDFEESSFEQAKRRLETLYNALSNVSFSISEDAEYDNNFKEILFEIKRKFTKAMNDDFNAPLALRSFFELAKKSNKLIKSRGKVNPKLGDEIISLFKELGKILGILTTEIEVELPEDIKELINKRENAREKRDWKTADSIRLELMKRGISLEDTKEGVRWKIKKGELKL